MKLLFSRYFSHRRILLGVSLYFILMTAAVMLFHADPDGDKADYIMCKFSALTPMMFAVYLPVIFMIQDTVGNRFMRSVPCAGSLYLRGIPALSVLLPLVWGVVTDVVYSAFILISGKDVCNISDMLIMTAIIGCTLSLITCFALSFRAGSFALIAFYVPPVLLAIVLGKSANGGFGLPLWASALIFAGGCAAVFAADLLVSWLAYRKCSFKETTAPQNTT